MDANAQAKIQLLAGLVAVGLIVAGALRLASSRDAGRGWVELALRVLLVRLGVGWAVVKALTMKERSPIGVVVHRDLPEIAWEATLGIWLIVRGFKPSPILREGSAAAGRYAEP